MPTTEQLNSALAGRYVIDRLVGEGGMATVYLARDVRHSRQVALKVLRPDLGAIVGVERFLSEIQVTANLQHPNLLPLFDSGAADGLLFYVMPYIEGESLRARLDREKQLPIEDALHIATACASALDYAHRRGVIHRDLKPENILLHEGQPVVADFGIALAVSNAGGNRITQTGLSLGTPQYMSPEQATGDRTIDARTDVYSLGAVTYEMLVGEAPHTGTTSQAIIARVLTERPRSIRSSRPNVAPHVEAAVEHALEKLPADRWASAKEFSEALTGSRPVHTTQSAALTQPTAGSLAGARPRRRELAAWTIAIVAIAALAASRAAIKAPQPLPAGRFFIQLPDSVSMYTGGGTKLAVSRDGKQMLVLGVTGSGDRAVYLRRMGDPLAERVRGTDTATSPAFSPNGEWIVYHTSTSVKKVPVVGGNPQAIADSGGSASWGDGGRVLYTRQSAVWMTSSDGGEARRIAGSDTARRVLGVSWPHMLPGGTHALVTYARGRTGLDSARIGVISLDDGKLTDVIAGTNAHYVESGHIVFGRPGGEVYAAPFSLRKRRVTGPAALLLQDVWQGAGGAMGIGVSLNGTLAYHTGSAPSAGTMMFAVAPDGRERILTREQQLFREPRLSPDGRRIAVRIGPLAAGGDMWIYDIATGALTRLTTDNISLRGEWAPDGSRVVFIRRVNNDTAHLVSRPWDRPGGEVIYASAFGRAGNQQLQAVSVGPANGLSAFRMGGNVQNPDIFLARTDSLSAMRPLISTPADEHGPAVSPNGRLLAYTSTETGNREVYLVPIPGPGPRIPVSIGGGDEPAWSRDGARLFYRGPGTMMAATIVERPAISVTRRDSLFRDIYVRYTWHRAYDVFTDGSLLLLRSFTPTADGGASVLVIVNWQQMLGAASAARGER